MRRGGRYSSRPLGAREADGSAPSTDLVQPSRSLRLTPRTAPRLDSAPSPVLRRSVPSTLETLSSVPLFANLNARQLRKVARSAIEDRYEAGAVIVREGGHAETLFVIVEGTAKVIRRGRTVARLSAGMFFGEMSMISGRPRVATVAAETPMRCLVLYHDALRCLVAEDPRMAWSLLTTLAGRISDD